MSGSETSVEGQSYGAVMVVGGGCYGSFYVRQLIRARDAGALSWREVVVVDRDPTCRATETAWGPGVRHVTQEWLPYFASYLANACEHPEQVVGDAIVPSPLMPHLMYQWLEGRARARWPDRPIQTVPLDRAPSTPWQRAAPDGTQYVSFATWMCPINCVEPERCPHTRETRWWTMPVAIQEYVDEERAAGRPLSGPIIFPTTHRAYGVGMFDVAAAIAGDRVVADAGTPGPADVLVATVSHCHGAVNVLRLG